MPRKEPHITPQDLRIKTFDTQALRKYNGFEKVEEDEAQFILQNLEALATVLLNHVIEENRNG